MNMHEGYMQRALELAELGWGRTNPNPLVGAVIVKNGKIIAEGYHEKLGCAHAEVAAMNHAREDVRGATLYVNLEPCSHYGRTPPCAKAIIERGISEVIIAITDPNPEVAGRGIKMLKEAGIQVVSGVLKKEAEKLNEIFIKYITKKRPFLIMKTAMTLDGKIATFQGDSKWISGESSRQHVHAVRDRVAAIMVGINTVLADNPSLTTRLHSGKGKDAVRIVVDSKGVIPLDSEIINVKSSAGAILATTQALDHDKERLLAEKGIQILKINGPQGHVDLAKLMDELYMLGIDSVLLEGGGRLNAAALDSGIVDKVMTFIAPKMIGGENAITSVEGAGTERMVNAVKLQDISIRRFDEDILVEGYVKGDLCLQE